MTTPKDSTQEMTNTNELEKIIEDHNKEMRADIASELTGGSRSFAITNVITVKAIQQIIDKQVREANKTGHWFAKEKQLDAYWNFGYWCNCGFKSSSREAIDGHVEWKKAELSNNKREGNCE